MSVANGRLAIDQEGKIRKFRQQVQEITFAGSSCNGREVLYVTERCVFRLREQSGSTRLELIEIAPGIRLQEDILEQMDFLPLVEHVEDMDTQCFQD